MRARTSSHTTRVQLLVDPVLTSTGHTYERQAIEHWLHSHDRDPMTNQVLPSKALIPNISLRNTIQSRRQAAQRC